MKKLFALALALVMVLSLVACAPAADKADPTKAPADPTNPPAPSFVAMTYAEFVAAEDDSDVRVTCYVQDKEGWWNDKITVYAADADGAYFLYDMACSEADAANLVPGTKINVTGFKSTWEDMVEIVDATFEFADTETFVADVKDVTTDALKGDAELMKYTSQLIKICGLEVSGEISYKNGEAGNDIYVPLVLNDGSGEVDYTFNVRKYLRGSDTVVYGKAATLQEGDVVDITGFAYFYSGHLELRITEITIEPR